MRILDLVCQGVECGGSLGGIMGANVFTTQGAPRKEAVRVSATRDKTAPSPAYTHDKHAHKLGRIFCRHISGSFDSASVDWGLLGVALLTFPQMDYLE